MPRETESDAEAEVVIALNANKSTCYSRDATRCSCIVVGIPWEANFASIFASAPD